MKRVPISTTARLIKMSPLPLPSIHHRYISSSPFLGGFVCPMQSTLFLDSHTTNYALVMIIQGTANTASDTTKQTTETRSHLPSPLDLASSLTTRPGTKQSNLIRYYATCSFITRRTHPSRQPPMLRDYPSSKTAYTSVR